MKKFIIISAAILFLLSVLSIQAQQWSAEQKEVWAGVEAYWAVIMSENPLDFLNYFDDSYNGWEYESETPHILKVLDNQRQNGTIHNYTGKDLGKWKLRICSLLLLRS